MSIRGIDFGTESKVQQQFKDDNNISSLVARANSGEQIMGNSKQPQFIDHTQFEDYTVMLNRVIKVRKYFESLPSSIRGRFENNPQMLLSFLSDPKNQAEGQDIGLLPMPPKKAKATLTPIQEPKPPSTPEVPKALSNEELIEENKKLKERIINIEEWGKKA